MLRYARRKRASSDCGATSRKPPAARTGAASELSAERARHASIEQILQRARLHRRCRAETFQRQRRAANRERLPRRRACSRTTPRFRKNTKRAIEQFLRDELEYVVVESFDHARAGVALLRDEMGGRATFFVDSLNKLNLAAPEADGSLPLARRRY